MDLYAGAGGVAVLLAEGVLEDALDDFCSGVVGVERKAVGLAEGERAEVVHAEDVVGVAVGVEHCIYAADAFAQGLGVEVRPSIDEDGSVVVSETD